MPKDSNSFKLRFQYYKQTGKLPYKAGRVNEELSTDAILSRQMPIEILQDPLGMQKRLDIARANAAKVTAMLNQAQVGTKIDVSQQLQNYYADKEDTRRFMQRKREGEELADKIFGTAFDVATLYVPAARVGWNMMKGAAGALKSGIRTAAKGVKNAAETLRYGAFGKPRINGWYSTAQPHVRTRLGDVEIDNPNLLYHLDMGDGIGAYNHRDAQGSTRITAENATYITPKQWTAAQDAAIARGDMVEAQRLRDLHFKVNAPDTKIDIPLWTSSEEPFNSFDLSHFGETDTGFFGYGYYLTPIEKYAATYHPVNRKFYVNIKNPYIGSNDQYFNRTQYVKDRLAMRKENVMRNLRNGKLTNFSKKLGINENTSLEDAERLVDKYIADETVKWNDRYVKYANEFEGKDGVLSWRELQGVPNKQEGIYKEVVVPRGEQIKSADAVTYDDNGVRIPLGERDNFKLNDVRYGISADSSPYTSPDGTDTFKKYLYDQITQHSAKELIENGDQFRLWRDGQVVDMNTPDELKQIYYNSVLPRIRNMRVGWHGGLLRPTVKSNVDAALERGYSVYDKDIWNKSSSSLYEGFYNSNTGHIAVKQGSEDFALGHEYRHRLDKLLPKSSAESDILGGAYDIDFLKLSEYYPELKDVRMADEAVTTNFDARLLAIGKYHALNTDWKLLNKIIDKLSDDEIIDAVNNANGYGRRYILWLENNGKLDTSAARKAFADKHRDAMKFVGGFGIPAALSIPQLNK